MQGDRGGDGGNVWTRSRRRCHRKSRQWIALDHPAGLKFLPFLLVGSLVRARLSYFFLQSSTASVIIDSNCSCERLWRWRYEDGILQPESKLLKQYAPMFKIESLDDKFAITDHDTDEVKAAPAGRLQDQVQIHAYRLDEPFV